MIFCRNCANLLTISMETGANKFSCKTCPYEYPINGIYTERTHLSRKEVDDVLGGADSWKNVDQTDEPCPKCFNPKAYYMMLQIRSADEPMTMFCRCTSAECSHTWRQNG